MNGFCQFGWRRQGVSPQASTPPRWKWGPVVGVCLAVCVATGPLEGAIIKLAPDATHMALGRRATGVYDPLDIYAVPGGFGLAFLLPPLPLETPRGGTMGGLIDFRGILEGEFGAASGWTFMTAATDLANDSLIMTAYDVFGGSFVGHDGVNAPMRTRGVAVRVPNDKAPMGDVHWIQVIRDNHNITDNEGHGNLEHIVDTASPGKRSPYYDDRGAGDARNFFDFARRPDEENNHYWIADLQLVTGPDPTAPGQVTIFNGFRYGWANLVFPSSFFQLHNLFHQNFNNDFLEMEFGFDFTDFGIDFELAHAEFHRELSSIPEPATIVLLAIGSVVLVGRRARRLPVRPR